jgi:hypothetical protein
VVAGAVAAAAGAGLLPAFAEMARTRDPAAPAIMLSLFLIMDGLVGSGYEDQTRSVLQHGQEEFPGPCHREKQMPCQLYAPG